MAMTEPRPHGFPPRGLRRTPSSSSTRGRFGRMFRRLPGYEHSPETLVDLAHAMIQPLDGDRLDVPIGEEDAHENTSRLDGALRLPAGYTYLGQFVDHDITFDPISSLSRRNDPDALVSFRTPRFDLDSVYGRGPADQPYLYADGVRFALGDRVSENPSIAGPDLQRAAGDRALIGDPRNDENLIVSQLQVAFLELHNAVVEVERERNAGLGDADLFELARQTTRWHYQWVVVHDFLPRLVGEEVVADILRPKRYRAGDREEEIVRPRLLFYEWREQPFIPVEFSVAAYRFGHSMARPSYLINDAIVVPVVGNASRIPLFSRTEGEREHLNGFRRLPSQWGIQWKYFVQGTDDAPGKNDAWLPQPSYKLDAQLGPPLGALPDSVARAEPLFAGIPAEEARSLAVRNLLRGLALSLPTGQDVAGAMGIAPLSDDELYDGLPLRRPESRPELNGRAPLWFYVLREAERRAGSERLGPVGGRIVAEVLIGLLAGDPLSYLSYRPGWKPTLPSRAEGTFTLADVVSPRFPESRAAQAA